MNISARTDYACRAVLELSLHWPSEQPVPISEIAKRQSIPIKFLTQILIQLKSYNFVSSVRGKEGGYLLISDPKEISLFDIVSRFDGNTFLNSENNIEKNALSDTYSCLEKSINNELKKYTFEDLAQKQKSQNEVVMFQI